MIENGSIRGQEFKVFGCGHGSHSDCAIDHSRFDNAAMTRVSMNSGSGYSTEKCPACERL